MITKKKKQNPYSKRGLIQARVDTKELQTIITKATMFCDGNVSDWIREAAINYKPITKVKAGK